MDLGSAVRSSDEEFDIYSERPAGGTAGLIFVLSLVWASAALRIKNVTKEKTYYNIQSSVSLFPHSSFHFYYFSAILLLVFFSFALSTTLDS